MVPTTTPNPDDTPPNGQVERQLYPEPAPAGHPALSTTDELLIVLLAHPRQTFYVFEGIGTAPIRNAAWLEFENGDRYEVAGPEGLPER